MTELKRTKQGIVSIEETNTLDDLNNKEINLHNIEDVLDINVIEVDSHLENKIRCGHRLNNTFSIDDKVIFKSKNNQLLGIYEVEEDYLKVWKNFV
jgi:tRNA U55 pseudouridine synthase TruB